MGLELAEFALNVEELFQVEIIEEWPNINTLDELVTCLEQKTATSPHTQVEADRVFQEGFLVIQSFLAQELEMEPAQLLPETEMAPLLKPLAERRRIWKKIRENISDRIPPLYGKGCAGRIGGLCVVIGFCFGLFVTIDWNDHIKSPVIGGIAGLVSGVTVGFMLFRMGLFLFSPLFSRIPGKCRTLGGLAKSAVITKICLDSNGRVWNRESIEKEVLRLAGQHSWIPAEKISLSTKITDLFD